MEKIAYAPPAGRKFNADGSLRPFPGNTVICFLNDPASNVYQRCVWVQKQLEAQPFGHKFTLLPPSSLHMTVIQLLCDQDRNPEQWSSKLPLDAPLAATDDFFINVVPAVPAPANFRMQYVKLNAWGGSVSIQLAPTDEATRQALATYRHAVAEAAGLHLSDTYFFHISLAYCVRGLTEAEVTQVDDFTAMMDNELSNTFGIVDTGAPQLTFFDDMFRFVPVDERHTLKTRQ